jgi:hypothetical protein
MSGQHFKTIEAARAFALAGNALLTLKSLKSGQHFTYKVQQAKADPMGTKAFVGETWFVKVLCDGSADEGEFAYLGMIRNGRFTLTRASKAGESAPSVKAFEFFMRMPVLHPQMEIRHEGKCGKCGRTLTVPESIDLGIGPECRAKMQG